MSDRSAAPSPFPAPPAAAASRGRILVVDDDRLVLATVVHGLADAGFDIIDADNGDDAILLAREHRPDLALLDIRMDGMSGFDVARYLRDALQVPFVFLSAFSDEATLAQIRALGALASLVKPLDIAQIIPAVEQALVQVRSQRDAALQLPESVPVAAVTRVPAEAPAAPEPLDDMVAIAVGIVMHRFSLDRAAALQRLERLARQEGRPLLQSCRAMVEALERLALAGGI
ncbi:response regulator receiver protein [Sphaerotilus natans subsp. natans DSM 6575]|uniref:Response regulator receiver protein n=1 Tax=Sphaerotilus natans subsp. natans DSM 6575 TaxID=1286631 RepID=A0A059KR34_9BURK|nr:response regulator [Sphaerotilus natans]KDB53835.1 response regulator receiver protein [Sphaerotilus natans subsp. natans DSM 6575]